MNDNRPEIMANKQGLNVLIVATGGVSGIVLPLIKRFEAHYGNVHTVCIWLPTVYRWLFLPLSFRWSKDKWWRRWMQLQEKTPFAFHKRTEVAVQAIRDSGFSYDFVVMFGALHDIPNEMHKPVFMFIDSTRRLSMENSHDEQCHFDTNTKRDEWLALEKQVYDRACRIFVGNTRVADSLVNNYGVTQDKVIVSGFGAGLGEVLKYHKHFDGRSILFIGKGDFAKKGGYILLEAFKTVRAHIPDAALHIVGQDNIPSREGVINHGFIRDRQRLGDLMKSCCVFTLPSLVDRNPLTVIEAMASSTPCVVSNYGAIPEILADAGIVVENNNVKQLADAIVSLLKNPELAKSMGEKGRLRYESIYNWDRIWKEIEREIRGILYEVT